MGYILLAIVELESNDTHEVQANDIIVAFLGVELHCESTRVASLVWKFSS